MSESDLRSLYEWIGSQHKTDESRSWVLGGVIGGGAILVCGLIPILLAGFHVGPAMGVFAPIVTWVLLSLAALLWYFVSPTPEEKILTRAQKDMHGIWLRLFFARWKHNVAGVLGADNAKLLDEGAKELLRTRAALKSAAWKAVEAGSPYARIQKSLGISMETAMARLVSMVGSGSSSEHEIKSLIDEMRQIANETVEMTSRISDHRGLPRDNTDGLRHTLREMRALNEADDEVTRMRDGS